MAFLEVFPFWRQKCIATASESVLYTEMPYIQSVLYQMFHSMCVCVCIHVVCLPENDELWVKLRHQHISDVNMLVTFISCLSHHTPPFSLPLPSPLLSHTVRKVSEMVKTFAGSHKKSAPVSSDVRNFGFSPCV